MLSDYATARHSAAFKRRLRRPGGLGAREPVDGLPSAPTSREVIRDFVEELMSIWLQVFDGRLRVSWIEGTRSPGTATGPLIEFLSARRESVPERPPRAFSSDCSTECLSEPENPAVE